MIYGNAGTIKFSTFGAAVEPRVLRCAWTTDSAGLAVARIPAYVSGTLIRYSQSDPDADLAITGTVAIELLDDWGANILMGLCATVDATGKSDGELYGSLDTDIIQPIVFAGPHQLRIVRATSPKVMWGVFDLHYMRTIVVPIME